ncbi:hypothetical protein U3516DRAFT_733326 [Neocallimastix sp. 'constans']
MKNIELLLYKLHLLCVFRPPLFNRQFQGFMDFSIKALYSPAYTKIIINNNFYLINNTELLNSPIPIDEPLAIEY